MYLFAFFRDYEVSERCDNYLPSDTEWDFHDKWSGLLPTKG